MSLPQIPGTIIAYRMWMIGIKKIQDIETVSLLPIVTDEKGVEERHQWLPMQPIVAKEEAGVFSFKTLELCSQYDPDVQRPLIDIKRGMNFGKYHIKAGVIGRVSIWGKIKEHTKGYICQYAYPYEFFLPTDCDIQYYGLIYRLAKTYMVRVREMKSKELHVAIYGKE